jgi:hypothetical protein
MAQRAPCAHDGGFLMRHAIAGLHRKAFIAVSGCLLLACVAIAVSTPCSFPVHNFAAADAPILVRSVALDRPRVMTEAPTSGLPQVHLSAMQAPAPAKTQTPVARRNCVGAQCPHLAVLTTAPPRRSAATLRAPTVMVALTTVSPKEERKDPSFSDRLLSPVGDFRDRVVGLISSLRETASSAI